MEQITRKVPRLMDDPGVIEEFKQNYEFHEKEWEREEGIYGPLPPLRRKQLHIADSREDFAARLDSLPPEPTVKDMARLLDVTTATLHHRIERGAIEDLQLPKPLRHRAKQQWRWKRETVIAFYRPEGG